MTDINFIEFDKTSNLLEFTFPDLNDLDNITNELVQQVTMWLTARPEDKNGEFEIGIIDKKYHIPSYNEKLFVWLNQCLQTAGNFYFPRKSELKFAICDSWMTRSMSASTASSHSHQHSHLTGILYLTDNTSQTIFEIIPREIDFYSESIGFTSDYEKIAVPSVKGKLVIYPSRLRHRVRVLPGQKNIRYTYIFNSYATGVISSLSSSYLEYNVKDIKQRFEDGMAKLKLNN